MELCFYDQLAADHVHSARECEFPRFIVSKLNRCSLERGKGLRNSKIAEYHLFGAGRVLVTCLHGARSWNAARESDLQQSVLRLRSIPDVNRAAKVEAVKIATELEREF